VKRWLLIALLTGCSGGSGSGQDMAMPDGGEPEDLSMGPADMTWATATHLPFPQLAAHSGHLLDHPQLVTVTYTDDPHTAQLAAFGDFLPGSQYFATVGGSWNIAGATHEARSWGIAAPAVTDENTLVANLKTAAMNGTLPMPASSAADAGVVYQQLLYLVYLPSKTSFTDKNGTGSCQTWLGFHSYSKLNGVEFFYAILPDCTGSLDDRTSTATHEIFEASTDPAGDGFYLDVDPSMPWWGMNGYENGDLCQDEPDVSEGGYALQRIYSNAAAMQAGSPCLPIPPGEQFFDVTADPPMPMTVPAGKTATFKLTGWSLVMMTNWKLTARNSFFDDFDPSPTLPASTLNNGKVVTVTLHVPFSAASGQQGTTQIFSGTTGHFWPLTVIAQ
jgi:hypothetical protein